MKKFLKQKVIFLVLLVALLSMCLFVTASGAEITPTASGSCGDSVTWEYYASTGELKILGSGAMKNYDTNSSVPWYSYRTNIKSITMAETVTTIGKYAFYECSSLTSFEIPSDVTRIGAYAFCRCFSLKRLEIPSSVTFVGTHMVYLCKSLESITVEGEGSILKSIDGNLYTKDGATLIQYAPGKTDKSFTVPDDVTSIFAGAFGSATLEQIIIPDSVTSIGSTAFYYCASLKSITLLSELPTTLGPQVFEYSGIEKVYVPASAVDTYKAHEDWAEYADMISASKENCGIISFGDAEAETGETVSVTVSIEDNPGVAIACITLDYDKTALTLKSVENGEMFDTLDVGLNLLWLSNEDCEGDGVLATLTFEISDAAEAKDYIISATFNEAYNVAYQDVLFAVSDGKITVSGFVYGDANGDSEVSAIDVLALRRYMANYNYTTGTSTVAVERGADANGDGAVTALDVLLMRKYMANYNYSTGSSTIVLGPPKTEPPVTSCVPVTTETVESYTVPYKADISIKLTDNGNGVYVADEIFSADNTYTYVEYGAGYAVGITNEADRTNKIETTVSYAWDGEYIYGYVVAKDPTLLAVGEDIADDPYNNWSYDGFEFWYKLGESSASVKQFWASLNGYALNAQTAVKSAYFDKIEWDCEVNRETNTSYLTFKILAKTEAGVALEGGDYFYTAIQMDDRRSAQSEVYYCATYNQAKGHFDRYVLAEAPEAPVTTVPAEVSYTIPYKTDISIELKDTDGDGVYTADEVFAAANTYAFVEKGAGLAKNISSAADKVNKIETTVSYAWDGEYIYGYVVAKDPTLLAVGEDIADDPYNNWSYDGFELWYKMGESSASVKQFWASLNGYALNAQTAVKSAHFDKIEWDCALNRETNTSYLTFKILAKTEAGVALEGGDSFYTAIQMDDRRDAQSVVYYCATYNQANGHFDRFVLAEESVPPVTQTLQLD